MLYCWHGVLHHKHNSVYCALTCPLPAPSTLLSINEFFKINKCDCLESSYVIYDYLLYNDCQVGFNSSFLASRQLARADYNYNVDLEKRTVLSSCHLINDNCYANYPVKYPGKSMECIQVHIVHNYTKSP